MSMVEFAENELNIILKGCTDSESLKMQAAINKDILDIIKLFSEQGHSGFSASYSLNILNRLMDYKPLTPITNNEDEWNKLDYDDDVCYQCKRCPSLFKDSLGRVYNVEGKIFSDDNGHTWFTSKDSRVYVDLPYDVPTKPEYVIIDNKLERNGIQTHILNAIEKLGGHYDGNTVTEDTLLSDLLDIDKFEDLEKYLIDLYNITVPLFSLHDSDKENNRIWNVINFVMKSDCESVEKSQN